MRHAASTATPTAERAPLVGRPAGLHGRHGGRTTARVTTHRSTTRRGGSLLCAHRCTATACRALACEEARSTAQIAAPWSSRAPALPAQPGPGTARHRRRKSAATRFECSRQLARAGPRMSLPRPVMPHRTAVGRPYGHGRPRGDPYPEDSGCRRGGHNTSRARRHPAVMGRYHLPGALSRHQSVLETPRGFPALPRTATRGAQDNAPSGQVHRPCRTARRGATGPRPKDGLRSRQPGLPVGRAVQGPQPQCLSPRPAVPGAGGCRAYPSAPTMRRSAWAISSVSALTNPGSAGMPGRGTPRRRYTRARFW